MLETPLLFLVFNRPEVTKRVFARIREAQPRRLFIAADGPRDSHLTDEKQCKKVREIVMAVDWDCEVKTLFNDENLGCGRAVSSAINWFFNTVEEGIILEDDTLPNETFFTFCQTLLSKYRHVPQVMQISGFNVCGIWKNSFQSYHFSHFGGIWGWATWKRAWEQYDFDMLQWQNTEVKTHISRFFTKEQYLSRIKLYDKLYKKEVDTWDLQWTFAKLIHTGLSVIPSMNLIENIGFGKGATHTTDKNHIWGNIRANSMTFPLKEPVAIIQDEEYDRRHLQPRIIRKRNAFGELIGRLLTKGR